MLYAWVGDQKRAPLAKGERTTCRDCGGLLTAVMPVDFVNVAGDKPFHRADEPSTASLAAAREAVTV